MLCQCGCGNITKFNRKGNPNKFIIGHHVRGRVSPMRGKHFSPEFVEKCKTRRHSPETRKKLSDSHILKVGKFASAWKGGITPLTKQIRFSDKYSNWRTQIFGRDNFTCQHCGVRGVWLEAHHLKSFSGILKEYNIKTLEAALKCDGLWDINNGITLCKDCHNKTKKRK